VVREAQDSQEPAKKNPYAGLEEDEDRKPQPSTVPKEAAIGAAAGSLYGLRKGIREARAPQPAVIPTAVPTSTGLQSYINSQLPPNIFIPIKDLERITGMPVRTMAEAQQAIRFVQGQGAERVAKVITNPKTGEKRNIYQQAIPGREPVNLGSFERGPIRQALGAAATATAPVAARTLQGAAAGAAGLPMALEMYRQKEPTDWTQWMSLLGSGLMTSRAGPLAAAGMAMQAPYITKNKERIAAGLGLGDINPSMFGGAEAFNPIDETSR
jgi:hypothetical protein